jgi:DNA-binding LacI/PurR family transcriptional regulator
VNKTQITKHRQICDHIRDGIASGKYTVGGQVPTEAELSRLFSACRQTVTQAMRELVQQGLLTRQRGVGTFVSRQLPKAGKAWGLLLPESYAGIFPVISSHIVKAAKAKGYSILLDSALAASADAPQLEEAPSSADATRTMRTQRIDAICREYVARGVAGMFFLPLMVPNDETSINRRVVETFDRASISIVLIDRDIYDYPRRSRFDLVGVANRRGSQVVVEHLIGLGCRRIEYISYEGSASTASARIAGYQDALRDAGIAPDPKCIHHINVLDLDEIRQIVRTGSMDAFACVDDYVAAYVMRHLAALGIRVPNDIAVVGFDDVDYARLVGPPLTTMRQPCARIGEAAAQLMYERLTDPNLPTREISFECELIVRESCGANLRSRKPVTSDSTSTLVG